jgi:acetyl esterase/lipase
MNGEMRDELQELLRTQNRMVFTGHSAGGAAAAYVYKVLHEERLKEEQEGKEGALEYKWYQVREALTDPVVSTEGRRPGATQELNLLPRPDVVVRVVRSCRQHSQCEHSAT